MLTRSRVHGGLTDREHNILKWLVRGLTDAEIAEKLGIKVKWVHNDVASIYRKLGVRNRVEATVLLLTYYPEEFSEED